jgi:cob(I)alamin adenosyltransferase
MVRLTRIYTRGGDKGETSLGDGARVKKHALRVAAYGDVDEANSAIGLARLDAKGEADRMLGRIQNDLFDLGADLCTPAAAPREAPGRSKTKKKPAGQLRIVEAQVKRLEREIDGMNAELAPLNSFVLPGGSPASAALHLARTIVRRAERAITALAEKEKVNPAAVRYVNRLSDHLFVLARFLNAKGKRDVLWVPGKNR